jgi:UDP-N-acetylglucosamine 2-epimerase (non-hydrolysing)
MKTKIITIIGTRPELIKMAPIIKKLDKIYDQYLVWSGQHYSSDMKNLIAEDLELRKFNLEINNSNKKNSFKHFLKMQKEIYRLITKLKPKALIFHGDTLTTLSSVITSNIFFYDKIIRIHIEGGYRSDLKSQIEERIRYISDHLSDIRFVQRDSDKKSLLNEGIKDYVHLTGNSINDTVKFIINKNNKDFNSEKFGINKNEKFILCTIHRAENVDNFKKLSRLLSILKFVSKEFKIVLVLHPRTLKNLKESKIKFLNESNIVLIKPLSYANTIMLIKKSYFVISDSGGIQEEAVILKKRCMVPLKKTPHHFYLHKHGNILFDVNMNDFKKKFNVIIKQLEKNIIKKFYHPISPSSSIVEKIRSHID